LQPRDAVIVGVRVNAKHLADLIGREIDLTTRQRRRLLARNMLVGHLIECIGLGLDRGDALCGLNFRGEVAAGLGLGKIRSFLRMPARY
jgi:hypothetical protein